MTDSNNTPDDDDIEWVSKSEMKREMHKLQAMGEQLLSIKASNLAEFPLSDELLEAIEESKRIKSPEAKRRHLQYIGKQMRKADVEAIQACLDRLNPSSDLFQRTLHQAESWRERLLTRDSAENEWFDQFPETDRQHFRSLIRAAKKEQSDQDDETIRAGKNSKKLLKWVREQLLN